MWWVGGLLGRKPGRVRCLPGCLLLRWRCQGRKVPTRGVRLRMPPLSFYPSHLPPTCLPAWPADEDMFTAMESMQLGAATPAEVFACTVGQKPSKAPFYVNDPADVVAALGKLAEGPRGAAPPAHSPSVSFA